MHTNDMLFFVIRYGVMGVCAAFFLSCSIVIHSFAEICLLIQSNLIRQKETESVSLTP